MVDDYGPEGFRKLVEERLGHAMDDLPELPLPDREGEHIGVHEQKTPGRCYVGFPVRLGLMTGRQMRRVGSDRRRTRR